MYKNYLNKEKKEENHKKKFDDSSIPLVNLIHTNVIVESNYDTSCDDSSNCDIGNT